MNQYLKFNDNFNDKDFSSMIGNNDEMVGGFSNSDLDSISNELDHLDDDKNDQDSEKIFGFENFARSFQERYGSNRKSQDDAMEDLRDVDLDDIPIGFSFDGVDLDNSYDDEDGYEGDFSSFFSDGSELPELFSFPDIEGQSTEKDFLSCYDIEIITEVFSKIKESSKSSKMSLESLSESLFFAELHTAKNYLTDANHLIKMVFNKKRYNIVLYLYEFLDGEKHYTDTYIYNRLLEASKKDNDTIKFLHQRMSEIFEI